MQFHSLVECSRKFVKGIEIITRRAIDLFQTVVKTLYVGETRDSSIFDFIFTTRLFWFLHEIHRHAEQTCMEEELFEKYEKIEDFKRAWKEYEEKREDKTPLWSQESFARFIQPLFDRVHGSRGKHG